MHLRHLSILPFAWSPAAVAQAPHSNETAIVEIRRCQALQRDVERLACFDKAALGLNRAIESQELIVLGPEDISRTRRSLFGFNLPRVGILGAGDKSKKEEFTELNSTIEQLSSQRYNNYVLVLSGGARWRTTEPIYNELKVGDPVLIRKGALNSYVLSVRGRRGTRVIRIG